MRSAQRGFSLLELAVVIGTVGVLAAAVLFFTVPSLTHSSLSNMDYWVDWANLFAVALGLGTLAAVFVWPLMSLLKGKARVA